MAAIIDTHEEEMTVIGAICCEPKLIRVVSGIVEPKHFFYERYRTVYEYALETDMSGRVFDVLLAADELKDKIPEIRNLLAECMEIVPTTTNTEEYAKLLRAKADERFLRESVGEALNELSGEKLTEAIASICAEQIQNRTGSRIKPLQSIICGVCEELTHKPTNRVDTGYGKLDYLLKGMWGGQLILIGARPAVGKSAFAWSLAVNAAKSTKKVVHVYSLEMENSEIGEREIVRNTGTVTLSDVIDRDLNETQWGEIAESASLTGNLPIKVDDSSAVKMSKVRSQALTEKNLGLIIIDYTGLMTADRKYDSRNLELGAISRDGKNLAKELGVPVVMLAQLSRKIGGDDVKPTLTDLRDSGELEQNASKCIFLWNVDKESGKVGVSVAKNRRGMLGEVVMQFDGSHMRFSETEDRYEEPSKSRKRGSRGNVYDDDLPMD